jgi:mannose/fructose/N-acetylgalactosamine-specific phosphotransferase system component IIB
MTTKVIHEPQLDTILMVERAIREAESCLTKKALLKTLPKQVQYQTFNRILEYLESSNKIVYDDRKIVWIFPDNPKLKKLLETSVRLK